MIAARRFVIALTLATGLTAAADGASAHPHVFIEVGFGLQFTDRALEAIDVTWRFDEFYSQAMLPDYMKKGEKQLSPRGVKGLYDDVFRALGDYRFYTDVSIDGIMMVPVKATGFMARVDHGALVFTFLIPLPKPMTAGKLDLLGFDPEYFIEYTLAGPAEVRGKPPRYSCKTRGFRRDTEITGPIDVAGLSCTIG
ncbi:DUF1007 family protein [Azospirillum sp. CT11-132]|uniref:DUF1007 family protein n=1 Tax=Azospirillum sp. CT11-132 TaxID=3396317 RepID=UPI0039A620B4